MWLTSVHTVLWELQIKRKKKPQLNYSWKMEKKTTLHHLTDTQLLYVHNLPSQEGITVKVERSLLFLLWKHCLECCQLHLLLKVKRKKIWEVHIVFAKINIGIFSEQMWIDSCIFNIRIHATNLLVRSHYLELPTLL